MSSNFNESERVFPSKSDTELWQQTLTFVTQKYPERGLESHVRWAFEAVCDELDDYLTLKSFLRKVATKWMWERPALPRGVEGDKGWRQIKPANLPEDWDKE
ncbi:hypothetical protein LJB93_01185 [Desulfovibrio sp. OttesenSCG-928-F07]|nr:hypothetical protein [Desulfovibrio sp. OttesenSCG-928-F07]